MLVGAVQSERAALSGERLAVTCWCERMILWVAKSEVCAGRTRSCGRAGCHE